MRNRLTSALVLLAIVASACSALAQSTPNFVYGQVPTAAQWNAAFGAKQDLLGYTPVNRAGDAMTGKLTTTVSVPARAGLNVPQGTAPTLPVNGDLWMTSTGLFARVNGTTIGPFATTSAGSFAATAPMGVTFPAGVVTYALSFNSSLVNSAGSLGINLAHGNTFTAAQAINLNAASVTPLTDSIFSVSAADASAARVQATAFGALAHFTGAVYGGTAASPTAVTNNTQITGLNAYAYNGASLVGPIASFRTFAGENIASGHQGSYACIATTPTASTTLANGLCQQNDGGITVAAPTGGTQGAGTINVAGGYYVNGAVVSPTVGGTSGKILAGVTSSNPAWTSTPTLGASGTVGTLALGNATSGTVTLGTVAGALGSVTASLPANTGIIAETNLAQTWSATQTTQTLLAATTNTYDLGTNATTAAFRTIYAGTSFVGPVGTFTTSVGTPAATLGTQQTTQGSLVLANTAVGAFSTTVVSSNSATAAWTMTLPVTAGTSGFALTTNGSGVTAWTSLATGTTLTANSTPTSGFSAGNILMSDGSKLQAGTAVNATSLALGGGSIGSDALEVTGTTTHSGAVTFSGSSLIINGNINAAAWTTSGIRIKGVPGTLTDTSSSGTVATAYTDVLGGNTIAASSATTFTNYVSQYVKAPVAGSNVTISNGWAFGADSARIGTSNQFTVSTAGATAHNATATFADAGTWGSGGINGSNVGVTTPGTGKFTTLTATGQLQFSGITGGGAIAFALCTDASGILVQNSSANCYPSGTAAAGGSPTQVQYNSGGALAANSGITYDGTSLFQTTVQFEVNTARTIASATAATLRDLYVAAATTTITGNTGSPITALSKVYIGQPTLTDASAVTVTDAASFYVDNAPAAAGSVTITNPWAIRVGAGNVSFPGTGNVLGTITSGTWNGGVVAGQYGGTGVANTGKTITLAASVTTTGAGAPTLAFSGTGRTYTFQDAASTVAALDITSQTMSGGVHLTAYSIGTVTSGTTTIDCGNNPVQYLTNGGAFTLAAPANDSSCLVMITNNGSAGAITFTGFTVGGNTGDALTTINGNAFTASIWRINGVAGYRVAAMQ